MQKNSNFSDEFSYNIIGLQVLGTGKNYKEILINHVRPNSPAALYGLLEDDKILKIGIINTYSFTIGEIYETFYRRKGKKIRLKIERNGEKMTKTIPILPEI